MTCNALCVLGITCGVVFSHCVTLFHYCDSFSTSGKTILFALV